MPLTMHFILFHLAHDDACLRSYYDGRRQLYQLVTKPLVDGSVNTIGMVAEATVRTMVTDGVVMNDHFNMDDEQVIYRVTLRGIELAPRHRPHSFPALARGEQRKPTYEMPDASGVQVT